MKAKLYSLFAGLLIAGAASAQCTITASSVTPNGLTVSATGTGTGATVPQYAWDWGDQTTPTLTQTASHTYAQAGTYTVCLGYVDLLNTSCFDSTCTTITVTAVGIQTQAANTLDVQAQPNPFSTELNLTLTLGQTQDVEVAVYDMTGKQVAVLHNGMMTAGRNAINWKPEDLAQGVYFLQVKAGDMVMTKKIISTSQK